LTSDEEETERIRRLVDLLGESDHAESELARYGRRALEPLLDALPRLGWSGRRDAVQLLEEIGDPSAGPALVSMLGNEIDAWLRAAAACALGSLNFEKVDPGFERPDRGPE